MTDITDLSCSKDRIDECIPLKELVLYILASRIVDLGIPN